MTLSRKPWLRVVPLAAVLIISAAGCRPKPEYDKSVEYTPESLAQELAFRFNSLAPPAKTSTRTRKVVQKAVGSKADEQSPTKAQSKAAPKKALAKTVDDVLDEVAVKVNLVKGM